MSSEPRTSDVSNSKCFLECSKMMTTKFGLHYCLQSETFKQNVEIKSFNTLSDECQFKETVHQMYDFFFEFRKKGRDRIRLQCGDRVKERCLLFMHKLCSKFQVIREPHAYSQSAFKISGRLLRIFIVIISPFFSNKCITQSFHI